MEIIGDPWKTITEKMNVQTSRLKITGQCLKNEKLKHWVSMRVLRNTAVKKEERMNYSAGLKC